MGPMIELRVRSRISENELEQKWGKIVTDDDYNVMLTGSTRLLKPDGTLLAIYLPRVLAEVSHPDGQAFGIFHSLRSLRTDNRGLASGSARVRRTGEERTRSKVVSSAIIGAFDAQGSMPNCRLTAWTGQHVPEWHALRPYFQAISEQFAKHAPDRFRVQMDRTMRTDPAWVIPGTPFTTITVNNTYPTGVHMDKGDLDEGLSTLAVLRKGEYRGGLLVLARYRIAVDMGHGDLIMFDAHEPHGNTLLSAESEDAERISVVSYYRTNMVRCESAEAEFAKARERAAHRSASTRSAQHAT